MAAIDRFLPDWDVNEVHEIVLDVPPENALAAVLLVPGAPDSIVRSLLRLRGLPHDGSVEELLVGIGFEPLVREPGEVVFGAAGKPWRPGGSLGPFGEAAPGTVRIAANFLAELLSDGRTRLVTETRIQAVDQDARRAFRRYWLLIGPFSALIRRRWLAAARGVTGG